MYLTSNKYETGLLKERNEYQGKYISFHFIIEDSLVTSRGCTWAEQKPTIISITECQLFYCIYTEAYHLRDSLHSAGLPPLYKQGARMWKWTVKGELIRCVHASSDISAFYQSCLLTPEQLPTHAAETKMWLTTTTEPRDKVTLTPVSA